MSDFFTVWIVNLEHPDTQDVLINIINDNLLLKSPQYTALPYPDKLGRELRACSFEAGGSVAYFCFEAVRNQLGSLVWNMRE